MKLAGRFLAVLIVAGLALAYLALGFYAVEPDEQAIVLRLGEYKTTAGPSRFNWHALGVDRLVIRRTTVTIQEEFGLLTEKPGVEYTDAPEHERRMITGDTNLVNAPFTLQYKISNLKDYILNLEDPEQAVRDVAQSSIRAIVGGYPIDDVLIRRKGQIAADTRDRIQRVLDAYGAGVHILEVQLGDLQPPDPVKEAFVEVTSADQDRSRKVLEAEGYADKVVPEARGAAAEVQNRAEAYKQSRILRAKGDAERFEAILVEYRNAEEVTRVRLYIETLVEILPAMDKVIMEDGQTDRLLPYLPVGRRERKP